MRGARAVIAAVALNDLGWLGGIVLDVLARLTSWISTICTLATARLVDSILASRAGGALSSHTMDWEAELRRLVDVGDHDAAFHVLHRALAPDVRRFVLSRRASAPVDDVCQEVWAATRGALPRFQFQSMPRVWIFSIAVRKLVDDWRRHVSHDPLDPDGLAPAVPGAHSAPSTPESKLLVAERARLVRELLARWDPADRELLELRYVAGIKPAELATILGARANTLSQRIVRLVQRLRQELVRHELFASRGDG